MLSDYTVVFEGVRLAVRASPLVLLGFTLLTSTVRADDSKVCAQCHAEIYRRYMATPMARTSGAVDHASFPLSGQAEFTDSATGVHFRLARKGDSAFLHFSQGDADGERRLDYFIGAGVVGRSYASMIDGFLFQAPVSYYAATEQWDLSPGFEGSDHLPLARPVEPACLNCHASGLRNVARTVSGYESPAFAEAGVSCDRCHGPGEMHVARMKSGDLRHGRRARTS